MSIRVRDIFVYPVKGLDPHRIATAEITSGGSLRYDRMFAMKDEQGKYINGKKSERIHLLRSLFFPETLSIIFSGRDISQQTFQLTENIHFIEEFLSGFFQKKITFLRNELSGFPDDTVSPGPTVALWESIQQVCTWLPGISHEEMRRRFRPNIVLEGGVPFWEDHLLPEGETGKEFTIGDVFMKGINPSARCAVPPRHPETGDIYPLFRKIFSEKRMTSLPEWAPEHHFDHFYRFTVNTIISPHEAGKYIHTGDEAKLPINKAY